MPAFYLTLLAVLLAGIGGRDQQTVAGLVQRQGARPGVLIVAIVSSLLVCVAAIWFARFMLTTLPPPARAIFGAIALGLAGAESLLLAPRRKPVEPTNSLGALALVLLAQQVSDAPRFLLVGMAVAMGAPYAAGAAGAFGTLALVGLAWALPELVLDGKVRWARRAAGGVLLLVASFIALSQMGIL
ncbi:hypothetical protein I5E68_15320 [Novosphingobium sp. YJ-S2-02]|uniref:GDT1 family protein n=1 Tax=Novosphingobium aureum TaxID=2792964 RepID=A0A931HDW3_9SPHN|nr:hypothetical protein [Novosphingobium aureum]MBH0114315.1 hypothetical protein [Novosphingobium aureum]